MKATFLLSKDPSRESTGDLTMAKLVMALAREAHETSVICLSQAVGTAPNVLGIHRVAKPPPRPASLLASSLRRRRSLVHTRFLYQDLVDAVDDSHTDIFVADHCYMAEAVLSSSRFEASKDPASLLAVSTVVPEALVWRATRGVVGRVEGPRIVRDELRVTRAAYTVGTYDREEAEFYANRGIRRAHWLDLTLPATKKVPVDASTRRLVFLGDRRWAPNQEAYVELMRLWPRISAGIDGAELAVVGAADPNAARVVEPEGVRDWGFVDDLDEFLASCRALVAPIRTGGGVRVKILDAASRGLPVVGTPAAVGSLSEVLGIATFDEEAAIVEQCRRYLLDGVSASRDGEAIYAANQQRWDAGLPQTSVENWLKR